MNMNRQRLATGICTRKERCITITKAKPKKYLLFETPTSMDDLETHVKQNLKKVKSFQALFCTEHYQ
jgi:hypothetical protein